MLKYSQAIRSTIPYFIGAFVFLALFAAELSQCLTIGYRGATVGRIVNARLECIKGNDCSPSTCVRKEVTIHNKTSVIGSSDFDREPWSLTGLKKASFSICDAWGTRPMSTVTVSSAAALKSALNSAQAGDVIQLASGTYSNLSFYNVNKAGVTIASANPSDPAVIAGMSVNNSSGITFKGLEFTTVGTASDDYVVRVSSSKNITFDQIEAHGNLDGDASNDSYGFLIRTSQFVTVKDSEFYEMKHAINHLDSSDLSFTGNDIYNIAVDGIRGGGSSRVTITGNSFHDFRPAPGDHPDAVQFWTTNTTAAVSDIVVSNNTITRGAGSPMQGIFITDQKNLPFQNVTVENNVLNGTLYNGITVMGASNIKIANNDLNSYQDVKTYIRLENINGGLLKNNEAITYEMGVSLKNLTNSNNLYNSYKSPVSVTPEPVKSAPEAIAPPVAQQPSSQSPMIEQPAVAPPVVTPPVVTQPPVTQAVVDVPKTTLTSSESHVFSAGQADLTLTGAKAIDAIGNVLNNEIWGNNSANQIAGMAGDDKIHGGGGNDFLRGDAGNDQLWGDAGDDKINGGAGADIAWGGDGNDTIAGDDGNDLLYGDLGDDQVSGGAGNDSVYGGDGKDQLYGGAGNDQLWGGDGNDFLSGDQGSDVLYGGAGADQFHMAKGFGADKVADFNLAQGDQVKLTGVTSYTVTQVGADTVIDIGGGDKLTLLGINVDSLHGSWIVAG